MPCSSSAGRDPRREARDSVKPIAEAAAAFEALEGGGELKVLLDCRDAA